MPRRAPRRHSSNPRTDDRFVPRYDDWPAPYTPPRDDLAAERAVYDERARKTKHTINLDCGHTATYTPPVPSPGTYANCPSCSSMRLVAPTTVPATEIASPPHPAASHRHSWHGAGMTC